MKSSNLNVLAKQLFDDLNKDLDFFKTKIVIVPSKKMESFLKAYYLKNKDTVLMNVNIINKRNGLFNLFDTNYSLANNHQIKSIIIKYLNSNLSALDIEFKEYLNDSHNLQGIKLFDLANSLTKTFMDFVEENNIKKYQDIYQYVIELLHNNHLTTLYDLFNHSEFKSNDEIYLFGFMNFTNLEIAILNKYQKVHYYLLDKEEDKKSIDLNIIKAPNKLREIEYLHSKICNILLEDKNVTYSDFLVIGTNIIEYENEIARVFNQHEDEYPNIPYYINASKQKNNSVLNALETIKKIINKGFFTRLDFDHLINNWVIQQSRNITLNDIDNWRNAVIDMNVYREGDFEYAKMRLLASKICDNKDDNILLINDLEFVPYDRIGLDDESIVRFCSLIDDLNALINYLLKDIKSIDDLINIKELLDKLLSIKDYNNQETNGYYKKVSQIIDFWIKNEIINIPSNVFIDTIIDASQRVGFNKGELFSSGISFTEFESSVILPTKYLFIINASSKNLPIKKFQNPLNIKDINYNEEQKAFDLYCQNAEKVFISYCFRDLKTDEEFFLSNFVKELKADTIDDILKKEKEFNEKYINKISIDEDRPWTEIFTKREEKNKNYKLKLLDDKKMEDDEINSINLSENNKDNVVNVSSLGKFLEEPFMHKALKLFGSDSEIDELIEDEYEPVELSGLGFYNAYIEILENIINVNNDLIDEKIEEAKKKIILKKAVPMIDEQTTIDELERAAVVAKEIREKLENPNASIMPQTNLFLKYQDNGKENEWCLNLNSLIIKTINDDRIFYEPAKEKISNKDFLTMYVASLMDVARMNTEDLIKIELPIPKDGQPINKNIVFEINSASAISFLNEIYKEYINFENIKFMPFKYQDKSSYKKIQSIGDLVYKAKDDWNYFDQKDLINTFSEIGYSYDDFQNEFVMERNRIRKLFVFMKEDEQDE